MLRTSLIAKNCLRKGCGNENWLDIFSNELKKCAQLNNVRNSCFRRHLWRSWSSKNHLVKSSFNRLSSAQASTESRNENFNSSKSHFQEMLNTRKMQAHRSVLVQVARKEDIPFALAYFEKYGAITDVFSYPGESINFFLLLEFSSESSVQELFLHCGYQKFDDVFPVSSRLIKYVKKPNASLSGVQRDIKNANSVSSFRKGSISEVIQDIYESETLTELDVRLRFLLCALIKDSISGLFPHCDVLPFGSSVNGIGRRGCDLDLVIRLFPDKVYGDGEVFFLNKTCLGNNKHLTQMTIDYLKDYLLLSPGMSISKVIKFARVPILKMEHKILNLKFDVSFNNTSAVIMSDILHFCGEVDPRVRPLMHIVKKWASSANITQKLPGPQISNFGLANLVLFFLQTREPHPILPPLNKAVVIIDSDNSYEFGLQYLEPIEKWKTSASLNEESLAVLLKEFLRFVTTFNFHGSIISLLDGGKRPREENSMPFWIQYVMNEGMNVTKNVSKAKYDNLCEKAQISAKYLEKQMHLKNSVFKMKDFTTMLGIPSAVRIETKPEKFDVSSVFSNENSLRNRRKRYQS